MRKATTTSAAAKTLKTAAKVQIIHGLHDAERKKCSSILLAITVSSAKPRKPSYKKPQAIKELEELADIANAKAHPNMPEKYLAKAKYRDDNSNGLMRCIIDFIKFHGGQAERVNTMGIPRDRRRQVTDVLGRTQTIGSIEWRRGGGTVGSADISATINSKAVKIEVKIGKDKQSEAQRQYQAAIEASGGLYFIAKDFNSFVAWYHQNFG